MFTIEEKNDMNKKIRSYKGDNSFLLSLQRCLKSGRFLSIENLKGKDIKVLTDKQYEAASGILSSL